MRKFRWLPTDAPPHDYDLRRRGWTLLAPEEGASSCHPVLLDDMLQAAEMSGATERATAILLGVDDSLIRAHALALGFGEVLDSSVSLNELEQRTLRVAHALKAVPRQRQHGPLMLDLLLRDGIAGKRRLGLHPREFGLLWRLAQTPGEPVSPQELLAEVWRVNFRPETNSLAVHVCRLRAKLASVGLGGIVSTTPQGSYALNAVPAQEDGDDAAGNAGPVMPLASNGPMLDDYVREDASSGPESARWAACNKS